MFGLCSIFLFCFSLVFFGFLSFFVIHVNIIRILLIVELLYLAFMVLFVVLSYWLDNFDGFIWVFILLVLSAIEVALVFISIIRCQILQKSLKRKIFNK